MDPKQGPQDGPKDGPNPNVVQALEAPYHVAPMPEPSTQATEPPPFAPVQQSPAPTTGTQPVGLVQGTSSPATRPPQSSGPRRRGRPRKYSNDGAGTSSLVGSGNVPDVQTPGGGPQPPSGGPQPPSGTRLRPNGPNGNWPEGLAEGKNLFTGRDFEPDLLVVNTGEDVSEKIINYYNNEAPRSLSVISGSGYISKVTLRRNESSGGSKTFEGRYEIVTLSGSFISPELVALDRGVSGGLSISLAGADGLIGGMLDGVLIAASPIEVVVGSFLPSCFKVPKERKKKSVFKTPPPVAKRTDPMSPNTANVDHPIGGEQSHDGGAAAAGTSNDGIGSSVAAAGPSNDGIGTSVAAAVPSNDGIGSSVAAAEPSNDGIGSSVAAAGPSNDGIGGSSLPDLILDDWADLHIEGADLAGKTTIDANIPPQGE